MKTEIDHLLYCAGEEGGEIQQAAGKAGRFGLFDTNPKTKDTNWFEFQNEVLDMVAVYEMICDRIDRIPNFDRQRIEAKKAKVLKFMEYARERGQLEPKVSNVELRGAALLRRPA